MSRGQTFDRLTFGRARRRRAMHRRLRELDRLDARAGRYGAPSAQYGLPVQYGVPGQDGPPPPPARRGSTGPLATVVQLTLTLGIGGAAVFGSAYLVNGAEPLGTPPDVVTGQGTFAFSQHQLGQPDVPIAYSPCEPIAYVVNDAHAPPGGAEILAEAVQEVSRATGLVFEHEGATDELPFSGPGMSLLGRHGPAVFAWTSPADVPGLEGDVAGLAGSAAVSASHLSRYVTGGVALDGPDLAAILRRPDGEAQVRAIVMHELAHFVGLDHVKDPGELMHPKNLGRTAFGPGDLEGLAALGAGRC